MKRLIARCGILLGVALMVAMLPAQSLAQRRTNPPNFREFLLQYKGKDVLILDRTTGVVQYEGGDPSKAYSLTLNDVQNDYIVVTRNTDTDKRTFVYPISVIRRIIYLYDNRPYQKIVLELY